MAVLLFVIRYFSTVYALLGLAIAAIGFFVWRRYNWALLALALPLITLGPVVWFEVRPNWIYEMTLSEALILIVLAVYTLDILVNKKLETVRMDYISFSLVLYLAIGLLSFGRVIDYQLFIAGLKVITFGLLAYYLASRLIDSRGKLRLFLSGLAATAIILSTQVFYTFYKLGFSSKIFFERSLIRTPVGAIALVSALLVLILPVLLAYYFSLEKRDKLRPLFLAAFVLGWLAVFLTLGKGAVVSLLLGLAYLFYKLKNRRVIIALSLASFVVLSVLVLTPFFVGLFDRLANIFVDVNSKFRLDEYRTALKIVKDHLWLGVGSGQQLLYYQKLLNPDYRELVNNFFLQSLIDYGVAGLAGLLLIVHALWRTVKNKANRTKAEAILWAGFIASLIAAFFNGLVEVTFFALPYAIIFWSIVGVFKNLAEQRTALRENADN